MTLEVRGISKRFGGIDAVHGVDLTVERGTVVGLVGPNGAGKTTCFNLITGFVPPTAGSVHVDGRDVTHLSPERRQRLGVSRTFQQTTLFGGLTALQNVVLAHHPGRRESLLRTVLPLRGHGRAIERAGLDLLDRLGIAHVAEQDADTMSYGDQRLLAIAIALAGDPGYLLLDEPAAGLNPKESARLSALLSRLRDDGLGVLVVEHDMPLIMGACDQILVLAGGRPLAHGTPAQIRTDPQVIEAYLGRSA
jgi:branched-chain amino acid transport system ATP-binding protein